MRWNFKDEVIEAGDRMKAECRYVVMVQALQHTDVHCSFGVGMLWHPPYRLPAIWSCCSHNSIIDLFGSSLNCKFTAPKVTLCHESWTFCLITDSALFVGDIITSCSKPENAVLVKVDVSLILPDLQMSIFIIAAINVFSPSTHLNMWLICMISSSLNYIHAQTHVHSLPCI